MDEIVLRLRIHRCESANRKIFGVKVPKRIAEVEVVGAHGYPWRYLYRNRKTQGESAGSVNGSAVLQTQRSRTLSQPFSGESGDEIVKVHSLSVVRLEIGEDLGPGLICRGGWIETKSSYSYFQQQPTASNNCLPRATINSSSRNFQRARATEHQQLIVSRLSCHVQAVTQTPTNHVGPHKSFPRLAQLLCACTV